MRTAGTPGSMSNNDRERTDSGASEARVASRSSEDDPTAGFKSGVNPLYGSEIMVGEAMSSQQDVLYTPSARAKQHSRDSGAKTAASPLTGSSTAAEIATTESSAARRPSATQPNRTSAHGSSPQSTLTCSTSHSSTTSGPSSNPNKNSHGSSKKVARGASTNARSSRGGNASMGTGPPPLVPAQQAPVPPPPPKRKRVRKHNGDIESGETTSEATVMENAPDKTLMEMLQSYLKKQDVYTRIVFVVLLLVLAGGVLGAYVIMLVYAIGKQDVKYIILSIVFSLVILWVLYKYCFSDQRRQDESAIAQDIATLYAAIPDHTASRGVSDRGRAQFTSFKYLKSEMLFTAVTDDGVSLGSERGSELMMEGADPSCPLCNVAYHEGSDLCLLPCLHVFHEACIHKWCNKNIVCPLCKRHLEAPEPLHSYPGYNGGGGVTAHSEPAGTGQDASGRQAWTHMLGNAAPGPASGHGSSRGLGGTRSDDGLWNDRVLNAAQRQMRGGHNRVTSFSSETRRHNSARGRAGGPPQSSSTGASAVGRSNSINTSSGVQQGIQRMRSSSFSTANERGRALGRVAHGTAPHRGGAGGSHRPGDPSSPRATSDLGVRTSEPNQHAEDDVLGRPAGGVKLAGDEGSGNMTDGGGRARSRRRSVVTVTSNRVMTQRGVHSKGQGPAVITVRKVKAQPNGKVPATRHSRRPSGSGMRSGGESESDACAERVFSSLGGKHQNSYLYDDDSPEDEVTTKALTYGPRKPRVPAKARSFGEGSKHRRQSPAGSNSAEETGSGRRHRRRASSSSKPGSGNHSALASMAATAEAVTKLLTRPNHQQQDDQRFASRGSNGGQRFPPSMLNSVNNSNYNSAASEPESGADSGSDTMANMPRRGVRGPRRPSTGRRHSHSGDSKAAHMTKGTPAPPMAPARVATWNSNASASAPAIDPSFSTSGDVADGDPDDGGYNDGIASGAAASTESRTSSPPDSAKKGAGRSWSIRKSSLASSSDLGVGDSSVTGNVPTRSKGPERKVSATSRLFGVSSAARIGMVPSGTDNGHSGGNGACYGWDTEDDESKTESLYESTGRAAIRSSSVQEFMLGTFIAAPAPSPPASRLQDLIKTYEKPRTSSDEKTTTLSDERGSRVAIRSAANTKEKVTKRATTRRRSSESDAYHAGAATESEQDDEPINRPKLSYKKNSNHRRKKSASNREEGTAATAAANDSGHDSSAGDLPPRNPDGQEWGSESPYARPKLSYGAGLSSSSRKSSLGSDSGRARKTAAEVSQAR